MPLTGSSGGWLNTASAAGSLQRCPAFIACEPAASHLNGLPFISPPVSLALLYQLSIFASSVLSAQGAVRSRRSACRSLDLLQWHFLGTSVVSPGQAWTLVVLAVTGGSGVPSNQGMFKICSRVLFRLVTPPFPSRTGDRMGFGPPLLSPWGFAPISSRLPAAAFQPSCWMAPVPLILPPLPGLVLSCPTPLFCRSEVCSPICPGSPPHPSPQLHTRSLVIGATWPDSVLMVCVGLGLLSPGGHGRCGFLHPLHTSLSLGLSEWDPHPPPLS